MFLLLALLLPLTSKAYANDTEEEKIEQIPVYGTHTPLGSNPWVISCEGSGCKTAADSVQNAVNEMLQNATKKYVEQAEAQELFCAELNGKEPQHCMSMFGIRTGKTGLFFW